MNAKFGPDNNIDNVMINCLYRFLKSSGVAFNECSVEYEFNAALNKDR